MSVRDIPQSEWLPFLEHFSRGHRAWLATVERVEPDGSRRVEAVERPLGSVTPEGGVHRVTGIAIHFQSDSQATAEVHVALPTRLRVDETAEGALRSLEIEDETGERTRIRFRATALPAMLNGLAPGEL